MAHIAIQIRVGSSPENFQKGSEYYFAVGSNESKISSEEILKLLQEVIEDKIVEKYGEPRELDKQ